MVRGIKLPDMVQHKRNYTIHSRDYISNYVHKKMEMKKPVELWQMVIGLITFAIGLGTIAVNTSNQLTNHESRLRSLETATDKIMMRFDKVDEKQDKQDEKTTQILILLQNKQDRK